MWVVCLSCYDFTSLTDSLFLMPLTGFEKVVKHIFVSFPAIRYNLVCSKKSQIAYVEVFTAVKSYQWQNPHEIVRQRHSCQCNPSSLALACSANWVKQGSRKSLVKGHASKEGIVHTQGVALVYDLDFLSFPSWIL